MEGRAAYRTVEGDQAGFFVDGVQERGDVAVADQDFRLAFDQVVVEVWEDSGRAPAAGVARCRQSTETTPLRYALL
jgi:hypothetical protein